MSWVIVSLELKKPVGNLGDRDQAHRMNQTSKTHKEILRSSLKTYLEKVKK